MRRRLATVAVVLGLLSLSARAAEPIQRSFNTGAGGTLFLETDTGEVSVTSHPGNAVTVRVERSGRRGDDLKIAMEQRGPNVYVTGKFEHDWHFVFGFDFSEVKFIVNVPAQYNADLKTSGGGVAIANLGGNATARTSGGSLRLDSASGNADLHTSGGSITVGNVGGTLQAKTSGGKIVIHHAGGDVQLHTSGGGITIEQALGAIDAHTSGGSIHATFAKQPRADSKLETSGGSIVVGLAPGIGATVDARTSGGDVETDIPMEIVGKQKNSRINGRINRGGPLLSLRTSGGDIRIRGI